jgi:hypothetical protein
VGCGSFKDGPIGCRISIRLGVEPSGYFTTERQQSKAWARCLANVIKPDHAQYPCTHVRECPSACSMRKHYYMPISTSCHMQKATACMYSMAVCTATHPVPQGPSSKGPSWNVYSWQAGDQPYLWNSHWQGDPSGLGTHPPPPLPAVPQAAHPFLLCCLQLDLLPDSWPAWGCSDRLGRDEWSGPVPKAWNGV